jgi:hypothetical protein
MFNYGAVANNLPHIGLNGSVGGSVPGGGPGLKIVSETWMNSGTSSSMSVPALSVMVTPPTTSGAVNYVTFFAAVTSGGQTSGAWYEIPYTPASSQQLKLINFTSSTETLSNVGFMLSPTEIPLDSIGMS